MITNSNELYHYGVLGMKWGHHKPSYDEARNNYKSTKKSYNKAFHKAYRYSERHPISQFTSKSKKQESDSLWKDALNKADSYVSAKANYKNEKSARKQALTSTYNTIKKESSVHDRLMYNDATRKKAAKYVVDRNMSMAEASNKAKGDAKRNTMLMLAAVGATSAAYLYANDAYLRGKY